MYAERELIMPSKPDRPVLPPKPDPAPRPMSAQLESVRERERGLIKKRKGYMSTLATRPGGLGSLQIEKKKALGA